MADPDGPIDVAAVGSNGIDELGKNLQMDTVSWALQRIIVGTGSLARAKWVSITCIGGDTPPILRGRLCTRTPEALGLLGHANVSMEISQPEECTRDEVLREVLSNVVSDHGSYTIEQLKEDYEKSIKATKLRRRLRRLRVKTRAFLAFATAPKRSDEDEEAPAAPAAPEAAEATAAPAESADGAAEKGEPTDVPIDKVLTAVADQKGEFNWAILEPTKLALHNAGCGGFEEMKDWFEPNKVMFGVIRVSVGAGISKQVFIHWIGPEASTVKKGQWNSKVPAAQEKIRGFLSINHSMTAHGIEDLDLAEMMKELKMLTYGTEEFEAKEKDVSALKEHHLEEVDAVRGHVKQVMADITRAESSRKIIEEPPKEEHEIEVDEDEEEAEEEVYVPPLAEAMSDLRKKDGQWNWVLLKVKGC